jgi:hypothetical protein
MTEMFSALKELPVDWRTNTHLQQVDDIVDNRDY